MATSVPSAGSNAFKWLEQLTSKDSTFSVWPVDVTVRGQARPTTECLFPPYGLLAAIYIHFVEPAQPDNEYHTLSHDVVFTMTLSKALRMSLSEMGNLCPPQQVVVVRGSTAAACYGSYSNAWLECPYHHWHVFPTLIYWVHLSEAIGEHSDWLLLSKVVPEVFRGKRNNNNSFFGSISVTKDQEKYLAACCRCACQQGELRMVKFLLSLRKQTGAAVALPIVDINGELLHTACENGQAAMVQYLLSVGADITVVDQVGRAPFHWAFQNADTEVLSVLLKVSKNYDVNVKDGDGKTPLHYAARSGRVKAIQMLTTSGCEVDSSDRDGWTPLHMASYNLHKAAVEMLLKCGAAVDLKNKYGKTALLLAEVFGDSPEDSCAEVLKKAGATG